MQFSKTVFVTGASRGIGAATAQLFAARGYNVAIGYCTHEDAAQALAASLPSAQAFGGDVASAADVAQMIDAATARFGAIDVLVNNAAIASQKLLCDYAVSELDRMVQVNLLGAMYAARAVLPQMIHRKSGSIVQISSMWGQCGASCEVPYSATKAALIGFTRALAQEVGPSGIRVNCVAPGVVNTAMNAALPPEAMVALEEETPLGRIGTPEEIAKAVFFLASDEASFITGQTISPNGGFVMA